MPKEGEEAFDDETKQIFARKLKFKYLTKGFYCPDEPKPKKKSKAKEHSVQPSPAHKEEKKIEEKKDDKKQ
jgi:hypothetical protein